MFEAFNAEFAARCLKAAGDLPAGLDAGHASPLDLVNLECYFDPVLLRHLAAPRAARPGSLMAAPSYPLSPPEYVLLHCVSFPEFLLWILNIGWHVEVPQP